VAPPTRRDFNSAGDDFEWVDGIDSFVRPIDGGVNDALSERTLAVFHHLGDEVTDERTVIAGIATVWLGEDALAAWHGGGS
jgi:hypothetical protein